MKIYLVRHGEVDNPRDVLYGRLPDFHLSEIGKDRVNSIAEKLKNNHNIKKIYSSPLERTQETAEIIAKHLNIPKGEIIIDDRLIEIDCRDWSGRPMSEFRTQTDYVENPFHQTVVEPLLESGHRVVGLLKEIASEGKDAVVVSHGDPITGAEIVLANDDTMYDHYLKKGEFVCLEYDSHKWTIYPNDQI